MEQKPTKTIERLAEEIWQLPRREREALEDLFEEKFVRTALRRAKEIPRLRREGKLLSLETLRQEFSH